RSVRTWLGVAAVAVLAIVGLAVAGGGGDDGGDPATPSGGGVAGSDAAAGQSGTPGTVPLRVIPPAEYVGTVVPQVTTDAEVVTRTHLGPGGPYMNGPYAIASGDEGLWATAVGDDGTWQAVRVDAVTGERLAAVRIPGRVPSDTSHHGLALSGGYVWAPALRDGLFRIDASTNAPSGIVGVSGGVVGAALDGGDGAVWAVGHDSVVRRIDARTTEVTAAAMIPELGLMPDGVDLAYGGGTVWVTVGENAERFLIGFDPVTLDRRATYRVQPVGLVGDVDDIAADGDRVVITEAPPGGVTVIDGAEGRVLASHEIATAGIAIDGDRAWIMSPVDGRATVVWTRTGELLASTGVPVGVSDIVPTVDGGVWAAVPSTGDLVRLRFGG
ncbi:MAG TPA: hypothetical protein VJM49_01545, partial [Acidimicrobiales bacterium]|nr:hypothetical protein [Acidimicrobiales bacterium]